MIHILILGYYALPKRRGTCFLGLSNSLRSDLDHQAQKGSDPSLAIGHCSVTLDCPLQKRISWSIAALEHFLVFVHVGLVCHEHEQFTVCLKLYNSRSYYFSS